MPEALFFYFDFNCPYSWIAAERIMTIAGRHTRDVRWRAVPTEMLSGESAPCGFPSTKAPGVESYVQRDLGRLLRCYGLESVKPVPLSKGASVAPACGLQWFRMTEGRDKARAYALAVFRARFRDGRDIADPEVAADIASACGADRKAFLNALADPKCQAQLSDEVKRMKKDGVFALPFVLADGEPFCGLSRLDMLDKWLGQGGW